VVRIRYRQCCSACSKEGFEPKVQGEVHGSATADWRLERVRQMQSDCRADGPGAAAAIAKAVTGAYFCPAAGKRFFLRDKPVRVPGNISAAPTTVGMGTRGRWSVSSSSSCPASEPVPAPSGLVWAGCGIADRVRKDSPRRAVRDPARFSPAIKMGVTFRRRHSVSLGDGRIMLFDPNILDAVENNARNHCPRR